MSSKKKEKLKALLFDVGGTLAFLDYELLAREFSREGRKLDALSLEHAEYAGRAAIDRHLMSDGNTQATAAAYELFFRGWMTAAGIPEEEFQECATKVRPDTSRRYAAAPRSAGDPRGARAIQVAVLQTRD